MTTTDPGPGHAELGTQHAWSAVALIAHSAFFLIAVRLVWIQLCMPAAPWATAVAVVVVLGMALLTIHDTELAVFVLLPLAIVFSELHALPAVFYCAWYVKRMARGRPMLPETSMDKLLDALSLVLLLSLLVWTFQHFSLLEALRMAFKDRWRQNTALYPLEYYFFWAHGPFLLRIALTECRNMTRWVESLRWFAALAAIYVGLSLFSHQIHCSLFYVFFSRNYLEFYLAAGAFLLGFLACRAKPHLRFALWLSLTLPLYGVFKSSLRSLYIAMLITLLGWLCMGRRKKIALAGAALAFLVVAGLNLAPRDNVMALRDGLATQFPSMMGPIHDSFDLLRPKIRVTEYSLGRATAVPRALLSRLMLWERAAVMVGRYPLNGTGLGTFYSCSQNFARSSFAKQFLKQEHAHNSFLQLAAEAGLPALALWYIAVATAIWNALEGRRKHPDQAHALTGLVLAVTAFLLGNMADHPLMLPHMHTLLWSMLIYGAIPTKATGSGPSGPPRGEALDLRLAGLFLALSIIGHIARLLTSPVC